MGQITAASVLQILADNDYIDSYYQKDKSPETLYLEDDLKLDPNTSQIAIGYLNEVFGATISCNCKTVADIVNSI